MRTVRDLLTLLVTAGRSSGLHAVYAAAALDVPHEHDRVTVDCPITCLELSAHVLNALRQGGGYSMTVGDVVRLLQRGDLADLWNIGPRRVEEVRAALVAAGFAVSRYVG